MRGNQIEGEEAFGAAAVAVDGEGDALDQIGEVRQLPAFFENLKRHVRQLFENGRGAGARSSVGGDQLVVERTGVVAGEQKLIQRMMCRDRR